MHWTGTIWTILKEDHIRIITTKFGQNPVVKEKSFEAIVDATTDIQGSQ